MIFTWYFLTFYPLASIFSFNYLISIILLVIKLDTSLAHAGVSNLGM